MIKPSQWLSPQIAAEPERLSCKLLCRPVGLLISQLTAWPLNSNPDVFSQGLAWACTSARRQPARLRVRPGQKFFVAVK